MKLGIYCAGGFGKEVYDIALRINKKTSCWDEIFFIDDNPDIGSTYYNGKLISIDKMLEDFDHNTIELIIATGEPVVRKKLFTKLKAIDLKIATLIDPSSIISTTACVGKGVIITPFCSISSSVVIGDNVVINTNTIIGHDIKIGDHSVVSSFVNLGGASSVGDESYIGMGAQIKEGLNIGSNVIVGMGSVVFNDIPDKVIALGNPARPSRRNEGNFVFKKKSS